MAANYQASLEALEKLEACLKGIGNDLQYKMKEYTNNIDDLAVDVKINNKLKEFYRQSQDLVTQSCRIIEEQAIPYVNRNIQALRELMLAAD